jgi:hypothetical protein
LRSCKLRRPSYTQTVATNAEPVAGGHAARTALLALTAAAAAGLVVVGVLGADTDDRPGSAIYKPFVIMEEIFEMTGSFLFGVALLIVLAAVLDRRRASGIPEVA